jgi:hypothetical protein
MNTITTKTVAALALASSVLAFAQPALAADFSKLQVKFSNSVNSDCKIAEGYDPVLGCFINHFISQPGQETMRIQPTIYLRPDLPARLLPYVFFQNVGHYVFANYSDQELAVVFNPVPDQKNFQDVRKAASNSFAYWALGGSLTPAKLEFIKAALTK